MKKGNKAKESLLKNIRYNNPGISEEIIEAFSVCDRAFFVKQEPYLDMPQHIAHGQTISQPSTIARMLRLLELEKGLDILEVGANTGYHASLAAFLVYPGKVMTIEIFPDLASLARKNLQKLKKIRERKNFSKIKIISGNALDKKNEVWKNKYDRIYFTAGTSEEQVAEVHKMAKQLLKEDGLILYPTRESFDWGALELWKLKNKKLIRIYREQGYAFVPLLGKKET